MPTENRSSNTEMVSVKRELVEQAMQACFEAGFGIPHDALRDVLAQPAQHQGEPVAVVKIGADDLASIDLLVDSIEAGTKLYTHPAPANQQGAYTLADKVREALDRQACPNAWMVIAYEAIGQHFQAPADPGELERLRAALKFYADRDHFAEDIGSEWDSVSGEPANILWHEHEAWFVEDGSIARAALSENSEAG